MKLFHWLDERTSKMTTIDVAFLKIAVMAFALMVAKLVPALLQWPWYVYAILFVVFAAKPLITIFSKK